VKKLLTAAEQNHRLLEKLEAGVPVRERIGTRIGQTQRVIIVQLTISQ
jgi:hypothetical protein